MRGRITLATTLVAVAAAVGALSECDSDNFSSSDAGDAALDRRIDVARVDAGSDGSDDGGCSVTSDWPGFRRLTEFDPCAPADVLLDQDAGFNLTWTDCADAGTAGCKSLQLLTYTSTAAYATHDDAGAGLGLAIVQGVDPSTQQLDIFQMSSGLRVGEWRIDVDQNNGTFLNLTNTLDLTTDFLGWRASGFVAASAPAPVLSQANPIALKPYPAPGQNINWAVSEQVMAFQPFSAPYTICQVAAGTCVPMNLGAIAPAVPYLTFAWHDVVFAVAEHGTTGWAQEYVIHADGSISLLRAKPNAHIWAMATDGTTLVWKEVYGSTNFLDPQTTAEVWKAPFTTDKATLDATAIKVATLPTAGLGGGPALGDVAFFNGLYATYFGEYQYQDTIYTVDVTTGQVQSSPTGPGGIMLGLPYVDRNELWEVTRTLNYKDYLVRIPFSQPWN